jgi:hypothetical protein
LIPLSLHLGSFVKNNMSWTVFERTGFALYDFDAADDSQVSLRVQNRVEIQEEAGGWYVVFECPGSEVTCLWCSSLTGYFRYKGNVYHDNMITAGMFPASYVQLDPVVEAPPAPAPPMVYFPIVVTFSFHCFTSVCVVQPVVSEAVQPVVAEPARIGRVDLSAMQTEEMDVIEDAPAVRPTSLRHVDLIFVSSLVVLFIQRRVFFTALLCLMWSRLYKLNRFLWSRLCSVRRLVLHLNCFHFIVF